ncbi:2OG-Fe(II) oxygenase [Coniella lustricola]|uniref:2OG-Fe(II) oxygenase n=1 Tax=Coniella lustricola TaxID=2025994 RepID=A0A2T3ANL7_9PEZI|nr:2OG-Fe(II) oxygenase [Coniella lustricola]
MEELPIEPQGILWQTDFITAEHEARLVQIFRTKLVWPDVRPGGRISLHYGYTFDYKTFGVDPDIPFKPFPDWLQPLIPPTTYEGRPPEQVCLQYYPPGAGIPPHVDTHSIYDQLYSLSLGAPVMMQFRRGDDRSEVDLAPRSLMKMSGDSRLHWTHGIKKRKTDTLSDGSVRLREDRWSITYRWLRAGGECECGDAKLCDTAQRRNGVEREYRWKTYDADNVGLLPLPVDTKDSGAESQAVAAEP